MPENETPKTKEKREPTHVRLTRKAEAKARAKVIAALDAWRPTAAALAEMVDGDAEIVTAADVLRDALRPEIEVEQPEE